MKDGSYDGRGTLKAPDGKVYGGVWTRGFMAANGQTIDGSSHNYIREACR